MIDPLGLAPGDPYPTQHAAAIHAINNIYPSSVGENREYGGMIYRNQEGTYSYTSPERGDYESVSPGGPSSCPNGTTPTAYYHTHGRSMPKFVDTKGDGSEFFSSGDKNYTDIYDIDAYLGTPRGILKVYDSNKESVSNIGNIE